jgi:ferritin-like metal-binding protein YciE
MATKNAGTNTPSSTNGQSKQDNNGSQTRESLLGQFFEDQLKDIYYAEQQMFKALDELKAACTTEELEDAFEEHKTQTQRHIKRLEKVFEIMDVKPQGKKCEAMDGLIKEARTIINETKAGTMTRDAALIIAAQKVEHYEIATYGGLVQLAITMGKHRAAGLLDKTLQEEEETDHKLTEIAESHINFDAEEEEARQSSQGKSSKQSGGQSSRQSGGQSSKQSAGQASRQTAEPELSGAAF